MLVAVAPVLHSKVPLQPVALIVALAPLHSSVKVLVITGTVGVTPVWIVMPFDELLSPQLLLQVAV